MESIIAEAVRDWNKQTLLIATCLPTQAGCKFKYVLMEKKEYFIYSQCKIKGIGRGIL